MPDELITLYLQGAPDQPIQCGRTEYYDHDFTTYKQHHPAIIDVCLFNVHGDLLLQKRGRDKRFNPGKLHVTVGGHVNWGEEASFSVVHECMEELGAPAIVFSKEKFEQAVTKLGPYAHRAALLYEVADFFRDLSSDPIESRRSIKDRIWFYFGLYNGPIENPDRSSAGYEWMDLEALKKELNEHPEQFTDGMLLYLETYGEAMQEFVAKYCVQKK